jgi:transglutaminase-like putative cysteine protease
LAGRPAAPVPRRRRSPAAGPAVALFLVIAGGAAGAARAADFAPVTAEERALTEVAGSPQAPAVVLFRKGDLDLVRHQLSSTLGVEVRLKILTEEGKEKYGEIEIYHSPWVRLHGLVGRTVLPDGSEVPLAKDSIFDRRASRSRRLAVTAVAFPALAVGAIVDYRYEVTFDSIFYLDPWDFQEEIPVRHSEIVYHLPKELSARAWSRDPLRVGIQHADSKNALGVDLRVWADGLPPIPEEPYGFPGVDLGARFMLVPVNFGGRDPLLESWRSTCTLVEEANYRAARRNDTAARRRAKEIAGDAASRREQALALYRFVRDEVETDPVPGVTVAEKHGPDTTLSSRRGDYADKAFLLQTFLDAVGADARLVWAASREDGMVDLGVPSFGWFDRVLVRTELDGEAVFLDPSEPGLAFGRLAPDYEGTPALLFHPRKPEVITLPTTPFEDHQRRAQVELALDDEGRLSGTGTLTLTGHHALRRIAAVAAGGEAPEKAWSEWLGERFPSFELHDVTVEEQVDDARVAVGWQMEQRAEEVLGEEVSLLPSRPLGPVHQPLTLPPERRRTPVSFDFADRDVVELHLTWPAGWEVEVTPQGGRNDSAAGALVASCEAGPDGHSLTCNRRLDVRQAQFMGPQDYAAIRALYDAAEKSDAQALVLVRR